MCVICDIMYIELDTIMLNAFHVHCLTKLTETGSYTSTKWQLNQSSYHGYVNREATLKALK